MGLKKKVTTKDIADHVGLSQSAVSMILNNKSNVSFSESTKKKVFDAAKELGYQKKKKQTESKNKPLSKVILIICPFLSNHYYTTLIHSITERAHDYGYLTFVAPTLRNPSTEQYYLDLMKNDLDTAGIIYLYSTSFLPEVNEMSKQIPIVNIGDKNDEITFDSIHISSVNLQDLSQNISFLLDIVRLLTYQHRSLILSVPDQNVMMLLSLLSKSMDLEMIVYRSVLFLLENIICFLQIFWNTPLGIISQSKSSRKERTALLLSDIMIW